MLTAFVAGCPTGPPPDGDTDDPPAPFTAVVPWQKNRLTYHIINFSADFDAESQARVFRTAFDEWLRHVDLSIEETDSASGADILIGFGVGNHCELYEAASAGCTPDRSFGPGVLAHAYPPEPLGKNASGDVHFNDDVKWSDLGDDITRSLLHVALHEFGHALGLADNTDDPASIMARSSPDSSTSLTQDDIDAIKVLYGEGDGPPPDPPVSATKLVESNFDADHEGWTTSGSREGRAWVSDIERTGYIVATFGASAGGFWDAPSKFTGDLSGAFGGVIEFDFYVSSGPRPVAPVLIISGTDTGIEAVMSADPSNRGWTPYSILLSPSGRWKDVTSGLTATANDLRNVLRNVTAFRIQVAGDATTAIDNVVILTGVGPICDGAAECDDDDLCTDDVCAGNECGHNAVDCGDRFCDPATGNCVDCLADTDCDDGVGCTNDLCNEETASCDNAPNDANCDDRLFCNGAETCSGILDCQAGTNPCGTSDICDEEQGRCVCISDEGCSDDKVCQIATGVCVVCDCGDDDVFCGSPPI